MRQSIIFVLLSLAACSPTTLSGGSEERLFDDGSAQGEGGASLELDAFLSPETLSTSERGRDALSDTTREADDAGLSSSEVPTPFFVHREQHPELASASSPFFRDEARFIDDPLQLPHLDIRVLLHDAPGTWVGTSGGLYLRESQSELFTLQPYPTAGFIGVRDISKGTNALGERLVLFEGWLQWVNGSDFMPEALPLGRSDLQVVAMNESEIWLGGPEGVYGFEQEVQDALEGVDGPVRDLALDAEGALWIASPAGVHRVLDGDVELKEGYEAYALLALDEGVWSGHAEGVTWFPYDGAPRPYLAGVQAHDCALTNSDESCTPCVDCSAPGQVLGCDICGDGRCAKVENASHCPRDCGIPAGHVLDLAYSQDRLAMSHGPGATLLYLDPEGSPLRAEHYTGPAWLPGGQVNALAFVGDALDLGTESGLSRIHESERRLSESAAYLESLLDMHFWRMDGFVAPEARLDDPRTMDLWAVEASEQDGRTTQMQVAAWCYAYAATGKESHYTKARKALDALLLLIDIPAKDFQGEGKSSGFVARSLVRDDEAPLFEDRLDMAEWHRVSWTDDHDYLWRGDTSSDDLTAHVFGYSLFYDLCAKDEVERKAVSTRAASMTRYIMEAGYQLLDLDGESTEEGYWHPERLTRALDGASECASEPCLEAWGGDAWLRSVEILGQLLATYHMSADPFFYEAYEALIQAHRYDELSLPHMQSASLTCPGALKTSDHESALLAFHSLIRYEADPQRRAQWLDGLAFLLSWRSVARTPLAAALATLAAGEGFVDVERGLESLREEPLIQQDWFFDNTHRRDALEWPNDRDDAPQFDRVFPYDELQARFSTTNPHAKVHPGDGHRVRGPTAWLLSYYAFLYSGVLSD